MAARAVFMLDQQQQQQHLANGTCSVSPKLHASRSRRSCVSPEYSTRVQVCISAYRTGIPSFASSRPDHSLKILFNVQSETCHHSLNMQSQASMVHFVLGRCAVDSQYCWRRHIRVEADQCGRREQPVWPLRRFRLLLELAA